MEITKVWVFATFSVMILYTAFAQDEEQDPCYNYQLIDDPRRSPSYLSTPSERRLCDIRLPVGWYRFQINGSDADMPTECVEVMRCGTLAPLWLSLPRDGLPLPGSKVKASACVTLTSRSTSPECCGFRFPVEVKNCLNYFVYKLRSTGGCDLAYCAQVPSTLCLNNQIYIRHLERCLDYEVVFSRPQVKVSLQNGTTMISCSFNIQNTLIALTLPTFQIDWYKGEGKRTNIFKSLLTRNTSVHLVLGEGVFPGDTIVCGVQSIHEKVEQQSDPYFLGIKVIPNKLRVNENRLISNVSVISTIPLPCVKADSCGVSVVFKLEHRPEKDKSLPQLRFQTCVVHFRDSSTCRGSICNEQILEFRMSPNLFHLPRHKTVMHGEIVTSNGLLRKQQSLKARVEVVDFPSASCYILSGIHIISLTGSIHKVLRRGTFILVRTYDAVLQVQVRITSCRNGSSLCVCGVAARYIDSLVVIDGCDNFLKRESYRLRFVSVSRGQDVRILRGRKGKLFSISFDSVVLIRIDLTEEGMSVSVLISGFYTSLTEGLCGLWKSSRRRKSFTSKRFSQLLFMPELWRLRPGQSYFDNQPDLDLFTYDVKQLDCDCTKSTNIVTCPRVPSQILLEPLIQLDDITVSSWNRTIGTDGLGSAENLGYEFEGDLDTKDCEDNDISGVSLNAASRFCDHLLYNSMISEQCFKLFKKSVPNFLDICVDLASHTENSTWIPIMLRLLEATCDMHVITDSKNVVNNPSASRNSTMADLKDLFLCPENCYGNGVCAKDGCACFHGYSGVECLKKADSSMSSILPSTQADMNTPTKMSTVLTSTAGVSISPIPVIDSITDTSSESVLESSSGIQEFGTTVIRSSINIDSEVYLASSESLNSFDNTVSSSFSELVSSFQLTSPQSVISMHNSMTSMTIKATDVLSTILSTSIVSSAPEIISSSRLMETENNILSTVNDMELTTSTYTTGSTLAWTTADPEEHLMFISCDKRTSNCGFVYLSVPPSYSGQYAVSCNVVQIQYNTTKWIPLGDPVSATIRYVSEQLIECMLPMSLTETNDVYPVYKVEILNAAGFALTGTIFAVIDSTCQKCARWNGCHLKNGTCFIGDRCYTYGNVNPRNVCVICNPSMSNTTWTINKDNLPPLVNPKPEDLDVIDGDHIKVAFNATDPEGTNVKVQVNDSTMLRKRNHKVVWETTVVSLGKNGSVNYYLFTMTDDCGMKTSFVLKVFVRKCGCLNNGTCVNKEVVSSKPSEMKCRCPNQYTGQLCEESLDFCASNPCYPEVACENIGPSFKCGPCPLGTVGNGQECKKTCDASPCFTGVNCSDVFYPDRGFLCGPCPRYFIGNGTLCVRSGLLACKEGVCSELSRCEETDRYPGYMCGPCPNGYLGNGTICTPFCKRPCGKGGTCTAPDKCTCHPGYTGAICNRAICKPQCQNRGRCIGNNKCSCPYWYTGNRCEKNVCKPRCRNGATCEKRNICVCPDGFYGRRCQKERCSISCLNGGTCYGKNRCKCPAEYSGRFCERPICNPRCINSGECVHPGICYCPFGFFGPSCEQSFCYPPCMNGGVCRRNNVSICLTDCQNGGKCVSSNTCACRSGWTGSYCQTPKCDLGCQNGGVCFQPNQCACKRGYWGSNCQYAMCWPRCMYGGRCVYPNYCKCRHRYQGTHCQVRHY